MCSGLANLKTLVSRSIASLVSATFADHLRVLGAAVLRVPPALDLRTVCCLGIGCSCFVTGKPRTTLDVPPHPLGQQKSAGDVRRLPYPYRVLATHSRPVPRPRVTPCR